MGKSAFIVDFLFFILQLFVTCYYINNQDLLKFNVHFQFYCYCY